jgi:glycine/D-amino acid oxidase-like deaminating enzyme
MRLACTRDDEHSGCMDRRTMLGRSALGLLGLAATGCASGAAPGASAAPPLRRLTPVRASWERVIRTTVGLRPYRPSGFVLRADRLDEKLLVHNFGHGGSGMSLSWGTARMAAELALEREERRAAVVGCGVVGLTTARQLQRRGFEVTIYAAAVPPDTTSNMSLAGWTPTSGLVGRDGRTPAFDAQFREAARTAWSELQLLVGRGYGVSWMDGFSLRATPPAEDVRGNQLLPEDLRATSTVFGPGQHPFPTPYAVLRPSLHIEPHLYLDRLVGDVRDAGGRIEIRRFEGRQDLASLDEPVVVNCTGLGAGALVGDTEIRPLKGQLTLLVPQSEVDYTTFGAASPQAGGFVHMAPRLDGIALGGTSVEGEWSLDPDPDARRRIVDAHIDLFGRML